MVGGSCQLLYTIHTIFIGVVPFSIMISFCFLILKNIRERNQIGTLSIINSNPQQRQRFQTDFQLIRLSIYQAIFFLISNSVSSINPVYTYSTINQIKTPEQRAIDNLISSQDRRLVFI